MSRNIDHENEIEIKRNIRNRILESRRSLRGSHIPTTTVEFSLKEALDKNLLSADLLDSLNAIAWFRLVSGAPEGGLGFQETNDTLMLLRLLIDIQRNQASQGLSGSEIFLILIEVLDELSVKIPIRRVDAPHKEPKLDFRESVLADHPPTEYKKKRQ